MSKEYTIFALDASKSMDQNSAVADRSDLMVASDFIFDYLNRQLIKNRKSDRFALVLFSSHSIEIIYENKPLVSGNLREFNEKILSFYHEDTMLEDRSAKYQLSDALKMALEQFQISAHLKFSRNLFVLTNGELSFCDFVRSDWSEYNDWMVKYNMSLTFGIINYISTVKKSETKQRNEEMCEEIAKGGSQFQVYDMTQLISVRPPLKLIGPRVLSTSRLSFGANAEQYWNLDSDERAPLSIEIQVFPAIKSETFAHGHEYYLDKENETLVPIKRSTTYYIKRTNEKAEVQTDQAKEEEADESVKEEEIIPISNFDCTPGFKFSPRDILAVNSDLQNVATLVSKPSIDILGFIKKEKFPIAYQTDESVFVLPNINLGGPNKVSFVCFVQALLELKSIAIVRYTQPKDSEVKVCVAYPQKVKLDGNLANVLLLVRIAMKEDEKIGRFPSLQNPIVSQSRLENEKEKKIDRDAADQLMEQFINSKKLKDDKFVEDILDNRKVVLLKSESIGTPITEDIGLDELLMSSNAAGRKFNYYISKILRKSLLTNSLFDFLNEDKFVEKYLSKDESSVLFSTQNVLDSSLIYTGEGDQNSIAQKLAKELDVKYNIQKKEESRRKSGVRFDSMFGHETQNDGNFDEYFDIDDILVG